MSSLRDQIATILSTALPDAEVHVESDDDTHFGAVVVSPTFEDMPLVRQHQTVLNALKDEFDSERLHALQLRTMTPERWRAEQERRPSLEIV